MWKKRKIDFVLYEDDDEILIFRFRPRQSSCHSFNEKPPTKWEEVFKVYYSYSVFRRWKEDNNIEMLFDCYCDECSAIGEVSARIERIVNGERQVTVSRKDKEYVIELLNNEIYDFGDGVSWIINECKNPNYYEVVMWKYDEIGYRFYLEKDKLKKFGEYLNECNEYMLAHGDPI